MIGPLDQLFHGPLRDYGLSVVTDPAQAPRSVTGEYPLQRLWQDPRTLLAMLQQHADHYGAPPAARHARRHLCAAASMWSKHYFVALLPAYVGANCVLQWGLPVKPAQCSLLIDADAHPVALCLPHEGHSVAGIPAQQRYETLVWHHLDPMVRAVAAATGLAPRLLWNNAATLIDDTLRVASTRKVRADCAAHIDADLLLHQPSWPDGQPNPLTCPNLPVATERAALAGHADRPLRRLCCLRYFLPRQPYCGNCPLPQAHAED